jgi:4-alpha-glucanotransferase
MAQELSDHERDTLRDLFREDTARQEELWERTGRERLSMVDGSTDALVCAEDLGAVPDCVPGVLDELGILGLRVERWTRHWDRPGQPFIPPSDYPRNTVCSPSVHDAHSLRGWWAEIGPADRQAYWQAMGKEGEPPDTVDPGFLQEMFERNLAANSAICVLALNDLLALEPDLRPEDPSDERINTPATDGEHNWRWRMPLTLEELSGRGDLRERIAAMLDRRRARPFR